MTVMLSSDGETWVSISGAMVPQKFRTKDVKVLPGNYQVTGSRKGYADVVIPLRLRAGEPSPLVTVTCAVPRSPAEAVVAPLNQ